MNVTIDFNLLIGVVGLVWGVITWIVQEVRIRRIKQKDLLSSRRIVKDAQWIMGYVEEIKKNPNCPPEAREASSRAWEGIRGLIMSVVENLLFQHPKLTQKQVDYWKQSGFLTGYVLTAFEELTVNPPRKGFRGSWKKTGSK